MKRVINLKISLAFSTLFLLPQASRSPSSLRLNTSGFSQIHPLLCFHCWAFVHPRSRHIPRELGLQLPPFLWCHPLCGPVQSSSFSILQVGRLMTVQKGDLILLLICSGPLAFQEKLEPLTCTARLSDPIPPKASSFSPPSERCLPSCASQGSIRGTEPVGDRLQGIDSVGLWGLARRVRNL